MFHVIGKKHFERLQPPGNGAAGAFDVTASLWSAAVVGHAAAVRALLGQGADVNLRDRNGWTPLMEAVFMGHTETVRVLLEHGADVNAADHCGWTTLMEAASKGRREIVKLLIGYGADVQAKSQNGWTALKATPKGNADIQNMLRQAGART